MSDGDDVPPGGGWDPRELVDEYARLHAERKAIDDKLEQLKAALLEVAKVARVEELAGTAGRMRFRRAKVLEVVSKDDVLRVLERRRLLALFATVRTDRLWKLADADPTLREELGASVKEAERLAATFLGPRSGGARGEGGDEE